MSTPSPKESAALAPVRQRRLDPLSTPRDAVAGLLDAVIGIPDSLAAAALVGVNPLYGLYAAAIGPLVGGMFLSSQTMMVTTTSASALSAGQAIGGLTGTAREQALFLFVILVGIFLVVMGLLKLGRLTRFVSHSVMTGFLIGVAVLLVLKQLQPLVGYSVEAPNAILETLGLAQEVRQFDAPTMVIGALTVLIVVAMKRTRLATFGSLIALIVPTVLVAVLNLDGVALVEDVSQIPRGIPLPALPSLSLSLIHI